VRSNVIGLELRPPMKESCKQREREPNLSDKYMSISFKNVKGVSWEVYQRRIERIDWEKGKNNWTGVKTNLFRFKYGISEMLKKFNEIEKKIEKLIWQ